MPLPQIERRVLPRMGGADYLGPELRGKNLRMKFMDNGRVIWVDVDPTFNETQPMGPAIGDEAPGLYFEHKYLYRRIKEDVPADAFVPIGKAALKRAKASIRLGIVLRPIF